MVNTDKLEYLRFKEECRKAHQAILAFWEWKLIRDILAQCNEQGEIVS